MNDFDLLSFEQDTNNAHKQMEELRKHLAETKPDDLKSIEDHERYIKELQRYRTAVFKNREFEGSKFNELLKETLAAGENGIYSKKLRVLFELIQNVDDCKYANKNDCNLKISFKPGIEETEETGKIILEYNEQGFEPHDVFAITGIAEESKNLSPDGVEIGEKGIGFKSVFGIATKVWIQSGKFSFELVDEKNIIPVPKYEDFKEAEGTIMTLFVQNKDIKEIYNELVESYCNSSNSLFTENPVLFLSNLKRVNFYQDTFRNICFDVSSSSIEDKNGLRVEELVIKSVLNDSDRRKNETKELNCIRYSTSITYAPEMWEKRYNKKTDKNKEMNLQIVVPKLDDIEKAKTGALYSFLPTKIKTTIPLSCHIPFKLTENREHVSSKDNDLWFKHSCECFSSFMKSVYIDLSRKYNCDVVYYLPEKDKFIFDIEGNDEDECLKIDSFKAKTFFDLPLFFVGNDEFKTINEIYCLNAKIDDKRTASELLNVKGNLFVPPQGFNAVGKLGIRKENDVDKRLFRIALTQPDKTEKALDIVSQLNEKSEKKWENLIKDLNKEGGTIKIDYMVLSKTDNYQELIESLNEYSISNKYCIEINGEFDIRTITETINDESFDVDVFDGRIKKYFNQISFNCCVANIKTESYLVANNVLVLSENETENSFAAFCRKLEPKNIYSASKIIDDYSKEIDDVQNSLSFPEFIKKLRKIRISIKKAFGSTYESLIKVINDIGCNENRFIYELLQNADDLEYDSDEPSFIIKTNENKLKTKCNEKGFSKDDIKSITDIGNSTKKELLKEKTDKIGEKGIGFKSVFKIAESVVIRSRDFEFSLSDKTPTIPDKIELKEKDIKETMMGFKLKKCIPDDLFTEQNIIKICLFLRKLKRIEFNEYIVIINDNEKYRRMSINGKEYVFRKLYKEIEGGKKITYLIHSNEKAKELKNGYLYNGLPTNIQINVPMSIDAPFELVDSREEIIHNEKNQELMKELYIGYEQNFEELCKEDRINVVELISFNSEHKRIYARKYHYEETILKSTLFCNNAFLNAFDLSELAKKRFVATCDKTHFEVPSRVRIYPEVVHLMMESCKLGKLAVEYPNNKKRAQSINAVLRDLGCMDAYLKEVIDLIDENIDTYIADDNFRKSLYAYLEANKDALSSSYKTKLKKMRFIPVKSKSTSEDSTGYIEWRNDQIFIDPSASYSTSTNDFFILDTEKIDKSLIERILGVNIAEMNDNQKRIMLSNRIDEIVSSSESDEEKYLRIMKLFRDNKTVFKNEAFILDTIGRKPDIPLKTLTGDFVKDNVFVDDEEEPPLGYLLRSHTANPECREFARVLKYKSINEIGFDDLGDVSSYELTSDDIEGLQSNSIKNGYIILNAFHMQNAISDELNESLRMSVIQTDVEGYSEDDFPNEKFENIDGISRYINNQKEKVHKIVEDFEKRKVKKIECNGVTKSLPTKEAREIIIDRYSTQDRRACFCQICLMPKNPEYIEVNILKENPKHFWIQMRIALCLECSKWFEYNRGDDEYNSDKGFLSSIKKANAISDEPVKIPLRGREITFAQKHLAEIQEILKSGLY